MHLEKAALNLRGNALSKREAPLGSITNEHNRMRALLSFGADLGAILGSFDHEARFSRDEPPEDEPEHPLLLVHAKVGEGLEHRGTIDELESALLPQHALSLGF